MGSGQVRPRTEVARRDPWWLMPLVGMAIGYVVLYASQLTVAWSLYLTIGIATAFILPIIAHLAGGIERVLLVGLVLALQFQLGFNPIYTPSAAYKQAGVVGLYISLISLFAFSLCMVRVLRSIGGQRARFAMHVPFVRNTILFFITGVLSMINTPNLTLSMFGLWEIATLTLIALVAGNWASTRDGVRLIRATLLVALFSQSAIILAENLAGVSFSMQAGTTVTGVWEEARFAGTLIVPSVSATFVVIGLLFTMGRLFSMDAPHHRRCLIGLFGIAFLVLLISLTRSAWIAFGIGGAGLGYYLYHHGTLTARDVRTVLGVALIMAICAWPALASRLAKDHAADAEVRWNLVLIAIAMIKAHPILGVGLNNATSVLHQYATIAGISSVWIFIVHNQFLLVAAETGLLGLAAFISVIGVGLRSAYKAMQTTDVLIRDTSAVVFWCLVSLVWALNLDQVSAAMTYVLLWFLVGVATGLCTLANADAAPAQGGLIT